MNNLPRTLVCIIGQARASELTWKNFKHNVLDELGADLALCIGYDAGFSVDNPFVAHAKYGFLVPEYGDYGFELDRISLSLGIVPRWRTLCPLGGNWIGGAAGLPGGGALNMVFRWNLCEGLCREGLLDRYDQFIITRSDFLYTAPHPVLDSKFLWVPDGEDWTGLCDRHLVVSSSDVVASLSMVADILCNPTEWKKFIPLMKYRNFEGVLRKYFFRARLLSQVRRFPYIMYSVRGEADPTRGTLGVFDAEAGYYVKYPSERALAISSGKLLLVAE